MLNVSSKAFIKRFPGSLTKKTETGLRPTHLSGNSHWTDGDISLFRGTPYAVRCRSAPEYFQHLHLTQPCKPPRHSQQTQGGLLSLLWCWDSKCNSIKIWTQIPTHAHIFKFPHLILGRCSQTPNLDRHRDPSACQNGKIVSFSYQLLRNHCIHGAIDQKGIAKNAARFSGCGYQSNGLSPCEATRNINIRRN